MSLTHAVLFTVENTDPQCFWLTNYLEVCLIEYHTIIIEDELVADELEHSFSAFEFFFFNVMLLSNYELLE